MKRALIFACAAIALLYLVRELEYAGIRRNEAGEFAKLRQSFLEKNNFDLVVIGSSRAEGQFYTPVIDSALNLHSFNLGMTGAVMPLIASSLEAYLVNSDAPKYVVLNLDIHSFADNPDTVYKFPRYFAYLENEKLYEGLQERDSRFFWFRILPFYSMPYYSNRYLNSSIRGWIGKQGLFDADYINGFAPSTPDTRLGNLDTAKMKSYQSHPQEFIDQGLEKIIATCKEHNSKLIVVISPLFYRQEPEIANYDQLVSYYTAYFQKKDIPLLNLSDDPVKNNSSFYADPAHLSKEGAIIFTRHFCARFMQYSGK